jgi:multimeric flavodoxin WrbA
MANINILAFCGSPRKNGNTELLLKEFLRGAQMEGATFECLHIADLSIVPCRECLACFKDGQCAIQDDMQSIYPRLFASDIIVFATPIFFYNVTGWSKAMIDRTQALWAKKHILRDPSLGKEGKKREGFFISACGTKGQNMFEGAILTVKYFFDTINARYAGELLFPGVDAQGDILMHPSALTDSLSAGKKIVSEFRRKGLQNGVD